MNAAAPHRGLTWDHPRGYNALAAAAELSATRIVQWDKQPLEGFESHPIAELAAGYDLLVLDHPHLGEAVARQCLVPLEDLFTQAEIAAWGEATVGQAMASYRWQDRHWALPLDVATQVSAGRPDRLAAWPATWDDVVRLSEHAPVALSIAGPHAILTFFSLCLALGHAPGGTGLVDTTTAMEAFTLLQRIGARMPPGSGALNPIGLLEAMAGDDGIAFVPLVYGYVTYARPPRNRRALRFGEAPTAGGDRRGSVLGGTGIAVTRRAAPTPALLDHLRWLMSMPAQRSFIPLHDGQPSARAAWSDSSVNDACGQFYRDTIETTKHAWVRPRFDGYIAFQTTAAGIIRRMLSDDCSRGQALADLRGAWRAARLHRQEPT
jgi:multiple sugar transport system substrate-binding protein